MATITAHSLAAALTRRGRAEDRRRAQTVARDGHRRAAALGMEPFRVGLAELAATPAAGPGALTRREENHVQRILTKLGFANRSQVAAWVAARANMSTARE